MRKLSLVLLGALAIGGCGYFPVPPDPIRLTTSPGEVSACRRIASVGVARTDGTGPIDFGTLTKLVPAPLLGQPVYGEFGPAPYGNEIPGPNFAVRLNLMRDAAVNLGASDLLLSRRFYHDYSYVEGIAYACRR